MELWVEGYRRSKKNDPKGYTDGELLVMLGRLHGVLGMKGPDEHAKVELTVSLLKASYPGVVVSAASTEIFYWWRDGEWHLCHKTATTIEVPTQAPGDALVVNFTVDDHGSEG